MDKKLTVYGIALVVIQILIGLKIFVQYSDMTAYAVSKSEFQLIRDDLKEMKADQKTLLKEFYELKK